jgi:hypothetical protein
LNKTRLAESLGVRELRVGILADNKEEKTGRTPKL